MFLSADDFARILGALLCAWVVLERRAWIGRALGLLDMPNNVRKFHALPTPKVGGLALFAAGCWLAATELWMGGGMGRHIAVGLGVIAFHWLLGTLDDRWDLDAKWRLALSFAVCSWLFWLEPSLVVRELRFANGWTLPLGSVAGFGLTVSGFVFLVFAVNLMDGRNGVLGSNALWWLWLVQVIGAPLPWGVFLAMVGAVCLFLYYNADGRLFAGDGGAYLIGSGMGFLALELYGRAESPLYIDQIGVWFLLPMLDAARVLLTRLATGRGPFRGGRDHLHHVLWARAGGRAPFLYGSLVMGPSTVTVLRPEWSLAMIGVATAWLFLLAYWPPAWSGDAPPTRT